jgi:hypothetical protein
LQAIRHSPPLCRSGRNFHQDIGTAQCIKAAQGRVQIMSETRRICRSGMPKQVFRQIRRGWGRARQNGTTLLMLQSLLRE